MNNSAVSLNSNGGATTLYRRDSNLSTTSFMDDVEMAHDEVSTKITQGRKREAYINRSLLGL